MNVIIIAIELLLNRWSEKANNLSKFPQLVNGRVRVQIQVSWLLYEGSYPDVTGPWCHTLYILDMLGSSKYIPPAHTCWEGECDIGKNNHTWHL